MYLSQNAQRVSWLLYCGEIPKNESVLRTCEDRLCTNPKHLYLGTRAMITEKIKKKMRILLYERLALDDDDYM